MSWLFGVNKGQQNPPGPPGMPPPPPPPDGKDQGGKGQKGAMDAYAFDSTALERAAQAAKELEKSSELLTYCIGCIFTLHDLGSLHYSFDLFMMT